MDSGRSRRDLPHATDNTPRSMAFHNEKAATVEDAINEARPHVSRALSKPGSQVLEAGCGSCTHFDLTGAHTVGIDISRSQLERNSILDEVICGDIQTHKLDAESFDAVVCWYVLEHVPFPDRALDNMTEALRPGGVLVVAVPSVYSIKGLVTKFSPHWFHVLVYRRLLGRQNAGKEGHPPFKTFLRWSISPRGIEGFARDKHLVVEACRVFEDYTQRQLRNKYWLFRATYAVLDALVKVCTWGRSSVYPTDFVTVLRKVD